MRVYATLACLALSATSVAAHTFDTLAVSDMRRAFAPDFIDILIDNTVSGRRANCGVYNAQGGLVATGTGYTSDLVTKITARYTGRDEHKAVCVLTK